ncbi:uncharacterized protein MKK02DRAFT_38220 [Dioszegia hungarica]|uniref:Uncharacterized protein n=1 Tax=Dioszegia hungarica TaxID=4972 RepID=A0AA38H751_9TREE|nr:uncharacterized protein MKK02DRAFT_38220 [Dioszegia hungarica]KAI9633564.1 hypothetical protein MKK02DRAFT_38220 [Dioszegia hungarica]
MSRRREAAELARVLHLSTQQARVVAETGPHTLSSPHGTGKGGSTMDSREMEIRALEPGMMVDQGMGVDPRMIMRPPGSSANAAGSKEASSSQSGNGTGSGEAGRSTIDQAVSTVPMSDTSNIQAFTPSESTSAPNNNLIPESSDMQLPPPGQPAVQTPASTGPADASSAAKGDSAGSTSQSRPLFSPTQGSRKNAEPTPQRNPADVEVSPPRPIVKHQYSRIAPPVDETITPAPLANAGSSSRPYQLSSSPDHPPVPAPVVAKPPRRSRALLEDSEDDVYDPSESVRPKKVAKKTPAAPKQSKKASKSAVATPVVQAVGAAAGINVPRENRGDSPDPLLIGPSKSSANVASRQMSSASNPSADTPAGGKKVSTSKAKPKAASTVSKGKGKEKEKELLPDTQEEMGPEGSKRVSSRVREKELKDEAEKLERRRKRAEEKARLAKEAAASVAAGEQPGSAGKLASSEEGEGSKADELEKSVEASAGPVDTPSTTTSPTVKAARPVNRKRILSSSPAPEDNVVAIMPGAEAVPVKSAAPAADTHVPPARAISVESVLTDKSAEAGPSKVTSTAKRPPPKKSATQTKKAAAAAKKAAGKAKAAAKAPAPKSREFIGSDDEEDGTEKGRAAAVEAEPEMEKEEDAAQAGPSNSKAPTEAEKVAPVPREPSPQPGRRAMPAMSASPEPPHSPYRPAGTSRPPLTAVPARVTNIASSSSPRHSPGPMSEKGTPLRPDGIKFKTERNDLASVLSKFPKSRFAGMSRRLKIAPLHSKIGPPKKELPPAPKKAEKRKKGDSDDDEDDEEDEEDDEDGEGGVKKKKSKEKGIEWYMMED